MRFLRAARSLFAVVLLLSYLLVVGNALMYLWLRPAALLRPAHARRYLTRFMKMMAGGLLHLLRFGGARFDRRGAIDTARPRLIVMNHQSLVDILSATVMSSPHAPAFVTRARYARFIPAVSPAVRMLDGPVVDPKRDPRGALAAVREAAPRQKYGIILFPEGHRSRDGEMQPFRTAGAQALLEGLPMTVQPVVTDGGWKARRLVDFLFKIHDLRVRTDVLDAVEPPASPAEIPQFMQDLRERMKAHLEGMRADASA
jgi:1-acyl-sn-glycerol-3-phosphate acyltransferase